MIQASIAELVRRPHSDVWSSISPGSGVMGSFQLDTARWWHCCVRFWNSGNHLMDGTLVYANFRPGETSGEKGLSIRWRGCRTYHCSWLLEVLVLSRLLLQWDCSMPSWISPEVRDLRTRLQAILGLADLPQLLFRIGYAEPPCHATTSTRCRFDWRLKER